MNSKLESALVLNSEDDDDGFTLDDNSDKLYDGNEINFNMAMEGIKLDDDLMHEDTAEESDATLLEFANKLNSAGISAGALNVIVNLAKQVYDQENSLASLRGSMEDLRLSITDKDEEIKMLTEKVNEYCYYLHKLIETSCKSK